MSVKLTKLVASVNNYLNINQINDYCPNGMQIEGAPEINLIACAVSANQSSIEQAIKLKAQALLVHHGYFWKNENPCITGIKYQRIKSLLENNISLLAYHLPLDFHLEVGNNVQLAKLFKLNNYQFLPNNSPVLIGDLVSPTDIQYFANLVSHSLNSPIKLINGKKLVTKVAICSGGGQNYFDEAISFGADVFITGEATEHNFHSANEYGVNFIAAGHHATERFGVQALGEYITQNFTVSCQFIDCANPF